MNFFIEQQVTGLIQDLAREAWKMTPLAQGAIFELEQKVLTMGVQSITPAEGVWLSLTLMEKMTRGG